MTKYIQYIIILFTKRSYVGRAPLVVNLLPVKLTKSGFIPTGIQKIGWTFPISLVNSCKWFLKTWKTKIQKISLKMHTYKMKCVIALKLSKEVQIKLCSYDVTGLYNDSFSKVKLYVYFIRLHCEIVFRTNWCKICWSSTWNQNYPLLNVELTNSIWAAWNDNRNMKDAVNIVNCEHIY